MIARKPPPFPSSGIIAALYLPTDSSGRIMKRALAGHVAWLRARGIDGILALGSTGEFLRFDIEERKAILALVAELADPLPVVANISDIRPRAVAELGRFARRLGLPGVAVMTPHFYPVSAEDQLAFFERAAEAAGLPVMLYNYPELTGSRISPETIGAFADRAPLAAVKQSGAEFGYHRALVRLGREKGFSVFSGADTRLPEVFALGVDGCIGGLANFVPEIMVGIHRACGAGRGAGTAEPAARMKRVGSLMEAVSFPLNIAAGIEARGGAPGSPKSVVSAASARRYRGIVRDLARLFRRWRLAAGPRPAA